MHYTFQKADEARTSTRARLTLIGPSGAGKTWTALSLAQGLGARVAVIDTEHGSAARYANDFPFHVLELDEFSPRNYIAAIQAAEEANFDVLVIDSLSHAWIGRGGALDMVNKAEKRYHGNSFAAWREVTPLHNALIDALVRCRCHLITTMRSKTEYVIEDGDRGRKIPRKIGLAPVQRDGIEYEFDIVGELDLEHNLLITKTRCKELDGAVIARPDHTLGLQIQRWLHGQPLDALELLPAQELARRLQDDHEAPSEPAEDTTDAPLTVAHDDEEAPEEEAPAPNTPAGPAPEEEAPEEEAPTVEAHDEAAPAEDDQAQEAPQEEAPQEEALIAASDDQATPAVEEPVEEPVAVEDEAPQLVAPAAPQEEEAQHEEEAPAAPIAALPTRPRVVKPSETVEDDPRRWKAAAKRLKMTAIKLFNGDHGIVLEALKYMEGVSMSTQIHSIRLGEMCDELEALGQEGDAALQAQLETWRQLVEEEALAAAI